MGVCLGDEGETPALTPQNEAVVKVKTQNALPRSARGRWKFREKLQLAELLRRHHFVVLNRRNLLETRQMAKARSLRFTGAAAGNGHNGSSGGGQGEKNTGHGMRWEIFLRELRNSEKRSAYLDGATYPGADGAGAGLLWQQEVAANVPAATAANAAIFTSFMVVIDGWFLSVLPAIPKECTKPNDREEARKEKRGHRSAGFGCQRAENS